MIICGSAGTTTTFCLCFPAVRLRDEAANMLSSVCFQRAAGGADASQPPTCPSEADPPIIRSSLSVPPLNHKGSSLIIYGFYIHQNSLGPSANCGGIWWRFMIHLEPSEQPEPHRLWANTGKIPSCSAGPGRGQGGTRVGGPTFSGGNKC